MKLAGMPSKKSGEILPKRDVVTIRSMQHMANPFKDVLARLEKQKSSIEKALAALREVDDASGELESYATKSRLAHRTKGKRKISAEGRQRMAEAQQRRWAAKRASESIATKKTTRTSAVKKSTTKKAATKTE